MDWLALSRVFSVVFIAELGDKTQLATLLFAADKNVSKWVVFCGASVALVLAAGLGVLGGTLVSQFVTEKQLNFVAGIGFIAIGAWTLWRG